MANPRNQRLISDAFAYAANDTRGIDAARQADRPYVLKLTGTRFNSLRGFFAAAVNLFDPPRHLEDFHNADILANDGFRKFRDALNDRGLDIQTYKDCYSIHIANIRYNHGNLTPKVSFRVVPWDGVKKDFREYDIYADIKPRPLFY